MKPLVGPKDLKFENMTSEELNKVMVNIDKYYFVKSLYLTMIGTVRFLSGPLKVKNYNDL